MKVAIVGDAHGHWLELNQLLRRAHDLLGAEAAIQVGDLGLDRRTISEFMRTTGRFALPLFAIDGNHDDHPFIARALRRGYAEQWRDCLNLTFQPRASTAQFSGVSVGFLGGALHVARPQRHGIFSGAPNYVRQSDARCAADAFNVVQPTLIVSHSCPSGIGIGMTGHPALNPSLFQHVTQAGFDPGPVDDRGEAALRLLWDQLQYSPQAWVFGHFHRSWRARVQQTTFFCVPAIDEGPLSELLCWESTTGKFTTETF